MKNYDYKAKMNQNRKRFAKRVGGIAIVVTLALSTPVASNVISESGFQNVLSSSVVEAATDNLIGFGTPRVDIHPSDEYEETRYIVYAVPDAGDQITFNDKDAVKYVVQLPENLWNQIDPDDLENRLKGNGDGPNQYGKFVMSGEVYKNGETEPVKDFNTSGDYNFLEYVSVNKETRSIEYDLQGFMVDHDLDLEKGIIYYDFETPIVVKDANALYKDTYTLKLAGVDGNGVDLANVSGAYNLDYEVTEGEEAPEPEPEPDPEVDKTELNEKINEAGGHDFADYTEESYASLLAAVEAAEEVNADDESTQEDIDGAIAGINEAIDGLVKVDDETPPADKVDLEEQLEEIEAADLDEADYTDASWKAFQDALKTADSVDSDEDATQDEVDESLAALTAAYEGLEDVEEPTDPVDVDKTDLKSMLQKIGDLDEADYTEASWKALQDAVTVSDSVDSDEDATQDEVDESLAALTVAYEELKDAEEPKPEPTPDPEEDEVVVEIEDEDESTVVEVDSEDTLPATATSTFNWMLGGLMAMLAGGLGLFTRRGKKSSKNSLK